MSRGLVKNKKKGISHFILPAKDVPLVISTKLMLLMQVSVVHFQSISPSDSQERANIDGERQEEGVEARAVGIQMGRSISVPCSHSPTLPPGIMVGKSGDRQKRFFW